MHPKGPVKDGTRVTKNMEDLDVCIQRKPEVRLHCKHITIKKRISAMFSVNPYFSKPPMNRKGSF